MRVPDEILKSVMFVGYTVTDPDGGTREVYGGTAFMIAVPTLHDGRSFCYLVTARHVADQLEGKNFWVRANTKRGTSIFATGEQATWERHPDDTVDVAVAEWAYPDWLDIFACPTQYLMTEEIQKKRNIGAGDEVFVVGLFNKARGAQRNIPIVRTGNVAMFPEDPVPGGLGAMNAYLIEARSVGGLSGSPVFVRETVQLPARQPDRIAMVNAPGPFYLMGLMHGHWDVDEGQLNDASIPPSARGGRGVNLGIALVVPAQKILEVLYKPSLVQQRADREMAMRNSETP